MLHRKSAKKREKHDDNHIFSRLFGANQELLYIFGATLRVSLLDLMRRRVLHYLIIRQPAPSQGGVIRKGRPNEAGNIGKAARSLQGGQMEETV